MTMFNGFMLDAAGSGGSSGGTGDVVGPASSTNNSIAIFDGTTGKLLESHSTFTVDATNNIILPGGGIYNGASYNSGIYLSADARIGFYAGGGNQIAGFKKLGANDYRMSFDPGAQISWVNSGDAYNAENSDTGLARAAAGAVRVTNGSTGIGAILNSRLVEANTAGSGSPNILALTESGTILTNEGATAENYHPLPISVAGYVFTFVVQDTDGIRIVANTGDTIRPIAGTAASAPAGFIRCATAGAFITLLAINSVEWVSIGSAGVWTIDV